MLFFPPIETQIWLSLKMNALAAEKLYRWLVYFSLTCTLFVLNCAFSVAKHVVAVC